jgi:SAM-dependent methyltransferase
MTGYEPLFAKYYDYLAHDRREAYATDDDLSFIRHVFAARCARTVSDVLDVGCGTGRYLIPLTAAGFRVTGLDNSPDMLAQCRARLERRNLQAALVQSDFTQMAESGAYDAVLCMDSTICYLTESEDIIKTLSLFAHALRPGGVLVLEILNAFANVQSLGEMQTSEVRDGDLHVSVKECDVYEPLRSVRHATLDVTITDSGQKYAFSHKETLRIMTAAEMTGYLKLAGFEDISSQIRKDTLDPESGDEDLVFLALPRTRQ